MWSYSALDKWIHKDNPTESSKRQLSPEQQQILKLEKQVKITQESQQHL